MSDDATHLQKTVNGLYLPANCYISYRNNYPCGYVWESTPVSSTTFYRKARIFHRTQFILARNKIEQDALALASREEQEDNGNTQEKL